MRSRPWFSYRRNAFQIELDYPIDPMPRYGYGKPVHPTLCERIEQNRNVYRSYLDPFTPFADDLTRIPEKSDGLMSPYWQNGFLSGLDAVALYCFVALHKPRRYFETGSGHSTRFVRQAIIDHNLPTTITSIDPAPRVAVESICDQRLSMPVEQVSLEVFDELEAGDMLFVDSSHRVFTNSDVAAIFVDVLPRLAPGVLVHFHDIFLPLDYPPEWSDRYYSEQYLLACYLLAGEKSLRFGCRMPSSAVIRN